MDLNTWVLDGGPDPPMGSDNFEVEGHALKCTTTLNISCVQIAELIEMPFWLWARVGSKNLVWGPDSPCEGTIFRGKNMLNSIYYAHLFVLWTVTVTYMYCMK